jgi:hypothetical protein
LAFTGFPVGRPNAGGVIGENPNGFAGVFLGKVRVTGTLSKGGGGFEIDHPIDPQNKYLSHSFVESPDMLNVYNGNVTTDAQGNAAVTLPDYFEALNREFRYQLTVIGQFAQAIVAEEIRDNRFTIKSDKPRIKVSWQVTGVRKDPWAVANRIQVEAQKTSDEKGRYLHPHLWERPGEARREDVHHEPGDRPGAPGERAAGTAQAPSGTASPGAPAGERLDRQELERLVVEAGQLACRSAPAVIDRARLEADWREIEASIQRLRPVAPRTKGRGRATGGNGEAWIGMTWDA